MPISILRSLLPRPGTIDRFEKMRACAGALFGIVLTGLCSIQLLGNTPEAIFLLAPIGASAVLLFAIPSSPLAQPWAILGGNIVAGLIGVSCAKLIGTPILAAALAVSLTIAAMFALRCLHPPSGAIALTAVIGGPVIHAMGYHYVLLPVAVNTVLLLATALFFNNSTGRRYPHQLSAPAVVTQKNEEHTLVTSSGITAEDLDKVLASYNQVIDISRDDLQAILQATEQAATVRRLGTLRCAQVMSGDVHSVEFSTSLQSAWDLLRLHRLPAVPVIDRARHVIGMLSTEHFIEQAEPGDVSGLAEKLRHLLRASGHSHSEKPDVVGQIMQKNVPRAQADQPVVELVASMAASGTRVMPVVDDGGRLVGMLTQADMIAALYRRCFHAAADTAVIKAD